MIKYQISVKTLQNLDKQHLVKKKSVYSCVYTCTYLHNMQNYSSRSRIWLVNSLPIHTFTLSSKCLPSYEPWWWGHSYYLNKDSVEIQVGIIYRNLVKGKGSSNSLASNFLSLTVIIFDLCIELHSKWFLNSFYFWISYKYFELTLTTTPFTTFSTFPPNVESASFFAYCFQSGLHCSVSLPGVTPLKITKSLS